MIHVQGIGHGIPHLLSTILAWGLYGLLAPPPHKFDFEWWLSQGLSEFTHNYLFVYTCLGLKCAA